MMKEKESLTAYMTTLVGQIEAEGRIGTAHG